MIKLSYIYLELLNFFYYSTVGSIYCNLRDSR